MRRKMGWTVKGIIGFIFAPMGLLFVLIGWFVGKSLNVSWDHANDSVIFQSVFCSIGGLFLIIGIALLAALPSPAGEVFFISQRPATERSAVFQGIGGSATNKQTCKCIYICPACNISTGYFIKYNSFSYSFASQVYSVSFA